MEKQGTPVPVIHFACVLQIDFPVEYGIKNKWNNQLNTHFSLHIPRHSLFSSPPCAVRCWCCVEWNYKENCNRNRMNIKITMLTFMNIIILWPYVARMYERTNDTHKQWMWITFPFIIFFSLSSFARIIKYNFHIIVNRVERKTDSEETKKK